MDFASCKARLYAVCWVFSVTGNSRCFGRCDQEVTSDNFSNLCFFSSSPAVYRGPSTVSVARTSCSDPNIPISFPSPSCSGARGYPGGALSFLQT
ncbi:hypothetical protein K474DRAFT_1659344 [Panus rudis PR-1116 ss-1]|nr:hypothetical protein K474DRAFT_1659344 [Panus rudis PR-1116 ss-1]